MRACRNGYNDIQYCEQVVANYIQNQIPLETFVTDIQYLNQNQDFTLSNSYPLNEFQTFVARLHNNMQRWVRGLFHVWPACVSGYQHVCEQQLLQWGLPSMSWMLAVFQVPILDPQIHIQHGYAPYDQGLAQNVFIRDMTDQPYNGQARLLEGLHKVYVDVAWNLQACIEPPDMH